MKLVAWFMGMALGALVSLAVLTVENTLAIFALIVLIATLVVLIYTALDELDHKRKGEHR